MAKTLDRGFFHRLGVTALVVALVAGGSAAWATHNFNDVPDGSFFGPAINEGAAAGCFTGFTDGTFRPADGTTRGQFAFWQANCGARTIEQSEVNKTISVGAEQDLATVTVEGPAVAVGGGYLLINAAATLHDAGSDLCEPCGGRGRIVVNAALTTPANVLTSFGDDGWGTLSQSAVHPIGAGESAEVAFRVGNSIGPNSIVASTYLTVTYVPFAFVDLTE